MPLGLGFDHISFCACIQVKGLRYICFCDFSPYKTNPSHLLCNVCLFFASLSFLFQSAILLTLGFFFNVCELIALHRTYIMVVCVLLKSVWFVFCEFFRMYDFLCVFYFFLMNIVCTFLLSLCHCSVSAYSSSVCLIFLCVFDLSVCPFDYHSLRFSYFFSLWFST